MLCYVSTPCRQRPCLFFTRHCIVAQCLACGRWLVSTWETWEQMNDINSIVITLYRLYPAFSLHSIYHLFWCRLPPSKWKLHESRDLWARVGSCPYSRVLEALGKYVGNEWSVGCSQSRSFIPDTSLKSGFSKFFILMTQPNSIIRKRGRDLKYSPFM